MLGENIAALRKKAGMTQQSLADALYVTRQTISKWEKNLSVPDADVLVRLADALDTTVQTLLGQAEEATAAPSDVAAALSRINDQLAIQNRRRARVWKVIAWLLAVFAAFNVLLLVLGYAGMASYTGIVETQVFTVEDSVLIEE
ncbi:MAG: helix-turn-helix transcriptional regulator [Clostridia bacterium]|nr:helix-turn-helix transcriptional regulator [Clostridia bacterium]